MVDFTLRAGENDWLNRLLTDAIGKRASDIHLEPQREGIKVRFRIDGMLYDVERVNLDSVESTTSRLKVLAGLDITEHRLPQDGHFEFNYDVRIYNIRVSAFPTIYGESIVMRILNREDILIDISELGFDENQHKTMLKLINDPYGMVLITGPSGSGKTTLLYSILNSVKKETNNIITIEDPVEVQMEEIRQTQVNEATAFTFAKALKAVLRQDPDIIMVGEIRDNETAQISIQAALTGRLVFSTFHTLNVFGVTARLIEMGVPRSVTANSVNAVISARLVRKICNNCKEEYSPKQNELRFVENISGSTLFKGRGCNECVMSGYKGRIGIFEVVPFDEEIRSIITENPQLSDLLPLVKQKGIKSLKEAALDKVAQGTTTTSEVIRVTGEEM